MEKHTSGKEQYEKWVAPTVEQPNGHKNGRIPDLVRRLDQQLAIPERKNLGRVLERTDVQSSEGPFFYLPDYKTKYPHSIPEALAGLYEEYNQSFRPLVEENREWDTDYQYAMRADGTPINYFVQIDMNGVPTDFLQQAADLSPNEVAKALRGGIFEYENSLAMYQLLMRIFSENDQPSRFEEGFRHSLAMLRAKFGKPIALLAVTDQKYEGMLAHEFGRTPNDPPTPSEVRQLTGFDAFLGPHDFQDHIAANYGESDYLLYARTSEPVAKLRDPNLAVESPLLADDDLRRIIKAHAITFNIDNPAWGDRSTRRINDTKAWMQQTGMAHRITDPAALYSEQFIEDMRKRGHDLPGILSGIASQSDNRTLGELFITYPKEGLISDTLQQHLIARGMDPSEIASGSREMRFKPEVASYGAYGHSRGPVNRLKTARTLAKDMGMRGSYVTQPEMIVPTIIDESDETPYRYIDRNFMFTDGNEFHFLGGFRSLMPAASTEAKKGRVHGNRQTRWSEIY